MYISSINELKNRAKQPKRVGRGFGSGKGGHTTGRGQKGQKSRGGNSIPFGFEGGQVPLYKKLPQMGGFRNGRAKRIMDLDIAALNVFDDGVTVTVKDLLERGFLKKSQKTSVKLLGNGELKKKLILKGFLFSESAKKKAEKAQAQIINA